MFTFPNFGIGRIRGIFKYIGVGLAKELEVTREAKPSMKVRDSCKR